VCGIHGSSYFVVAHGKSPKFNLEVGPRLEDYRVKVAAFWESQMALGNGFKRWAYQYQNHCVEVVMRNLFTSKKIIYSVKWFLHCAQWIGGHEVVKKD